MGFWIHVGPLSKTALPERVTELRPLIGPGDTVGEGCEGATRWQSYPYPNTAPGYLSDAAGHTPAHAALESQSIIAGEPQAAVAHPDGVPVVSALVLQQELEACARANCWNISTRVGRDELDEIDDHPGVAKYLARDLYFAVSLVLAEGTVALLD